MRSLCRHAIPSIEQWCLIIALPHDEEVNVYFSEGGEGIHGWGGHGVGLMSILCAGLAWNRMTFFFWIQRFQ